MFPNVKAWSLSYAQAGEVVAKPFEISHLSRDAQSLIGQIKSLDGDSRIVLECTGHYYEPLAHELVSAGLFVSAVNPQIIRH